ncbi:Adenylate kinase 7, partial [Quaeritorhiza haematococci]
SQDDEPRDDRLGSAMIPIDELIAPEFVVSLEAPDEFIKDRIMSMPESAIANTKNSEEALTRRLEEYRATNTDETTVLNFFDEHEIHPVVISVDKPQQPPQDQHHHPQQQQQKSAVQDVEQGQDLAAQQPPLQHQQQQQQSAATATANQQDSQSSVNEAGSGAAGGRLSLSDPNAASNATVGAPSGATVTVPTATTTGAAPTQSDVEYVTKDGNEPESTVVTAAGTGSLAPAAEGSAVSGAGAGVGTQDENVHDLVMKIILQTIGKPRNYGPSIEKILERRRAIEEAKAREAALLAEEQARREKEEQERHDKAVSEWNAQIDEVRRQEQEVLEAQSVPLRNYLMKFVMPTLSAGLIEVCRVRPE